MNATDLDSRGAVLKALTWQGNHDVRVEEVPDPKIEQPTDAIIKVTSSGICGSDLHLYEVLGAFIDPGDVLGHEPMGVVEEVGSEVKRIKPGDRVVIPFNISCGHCYTCEKGLQSQCETTQVHEYETGASLLGYTKLYGQVPGGQAEYLRVPQAQYGPIKVPEGPPDDRFVYLSDVLPTAWQAVEYANLPQGETLLVLGLGPIGEMCTRVAQHKGAGQVIAVDLVQERLMRASSHGVRVLDLEDHDDLPAAVRELTDGRGPTAVIDAVGMEAHGAPIGKLAHKLAGMLPDALAQQLIQTAGIDRLSALHMAIELVQRGGTVSLSGVYGGAASPMPLIQMFDKQINMRMGQANVWRWIEEILPLLGDDEDPLGVDDYATHHLPLEQAPQGYEIFQKKEDGAFKILLKP
ncbi:MAG TPA: zinc-dependent alcohol dehydrogenase [Solirubrobacteraceae bacterium]|jgi:threonine dehydrogenase-like Zn-dependent dehydrogenase|nr:zinc-dependent alcohol dehydrogenase [Solirubrobacteraceae bacterium]